MKVKKFSKEWFENKLKQAEGMLGGKGRRIHPTKGYRPDLQSQNKREQRIEDIHRLAKQHGVKL